MNRRNRNFCKFPDECLKNWRQNDNTPHQQSTQLIPCLQKKSGNTAGTSCLPRPAQNVSKAFPRSCTVRPATVARLRQLGCNTISKPQTSSVKTRQAEKRIPTSRLRGTQCTVTQWPSGSDTSARWRKGDSYWVFQEKQGRSAPAKKLNSQRR